MAFWVSPNDLQHMPRLLYRAETRGWLSPKMLRSTSMALLKQLMALSSLPMPLNDTPMALYRSETPECILPYDERSSSSALRVYSMAFFFCPTVSHALLSRSQSLAVCIPLPTAWTARTPISSRMLSSSSRSEMAVAAEDVSIRSMPLSCAYWTNLSMSNRRFSVKSLISRPCNRGLSCCSGVEYSLISWMIPIRPSYTSIFSTPSNTVSSLPCVQSCIHPAINPFRSNPASIVYCTRFAPEKNRFLRILFKKQGNFYFTVKRHGFLLSPSLFRPGTWFKPGAGCGMTVTAVPCSSQGHVSKFVIAWFEQESRMRKNIVTMNKEDTS
ncbi:hypothetical protein MBAV_002338 [Candidatus Magnetobacterium bavaricum]|uniref:Uncharacterized protein n=1 Tax=Candidatus Magnetobacterium bavaricum TaxID=29290 RepID=A0A0F3GU30_9BACT|nr:hypothetical protein MBAV_002338 [Candidatus Magnetobacterium bavaricum]